ncbi:MAG: PEP-CTERM sorting domain-containing protein [Rubrivivax sp.]|nr:MAG: PEP-CTERM sorting domain-containing protein [Rubrivivax sp.]
MKPIFKRVLAVTAFVAASAANAEIFIDIPNPFEHSSTATLAFSQDALTALKTAGVALNTPDLIPSIAGLPHAGATNAAAYSSSLNKLTVTGSVMSLSGDAVTSLSAPDSVLRLTRGVFDENDNPSIYRVFLAGFELNLSLGIVYANLYASDPVGTVTAFGKTAVFQSDEAGVVGGTGGNFVYGPNGPTASGSLAGNLRLTTQGADIILTSLGLSLSGPTSSETVTGLWQNSNWGTASFTAPAVPEPSTWALFGVGLLSAGALARRRQA